MFLWNRVIVPLSLCLLILFIACLIIFVFNIIETMIYTKLEEWKMRRDTKKRKKFLADMIIESMIINNDQEEE